MSQADKGPGVDPRGLSASHRDFSRALAIGPGKVLVPAIGSLIAYPTLVGLYGVSTLGSWAVLASLVAFAGIAEAGFTQLLSLKAAIATTETMPSVKQERDVAIWLLGALGTILALVLGLAARPLRSVVAPDYSQTGFTIALLAIGFGTTLNLVMRVDFGILTARGGAARVEVLSVASAAITWATKILAILLGYPLEGIGVGLILGSFVCHFLLLRFIKRTERWASQGPAVTARSLLAQWRYLILESRWFYALNLGFIIREPAIRISLLLALGPVSVAAWDVASRIASLGREMVAAGSSGALANIARSSEQGAPYGDPTAFMRGTLATLVPAGAVTLGGAVVLAPYMLPVWLQTPPPRVTETLMYLAVWHFITLINLPFHYQLLARGKAKIAATIVWIHSCTILLMIPASTLFDGISIITFAQVWLLGSIATQTFLYLFIERNWKTVSAVFASYRLALVVLVSSFSWLVSIPISLLISDSRYILLLSAGGIFYLLILSMVLFVISRPLRHLLRVDSDCG